MQRIWDILWAENDQPNQQSGKASRLGGSESRGGDGSTFSFQEGPAMESQRVLAKEWVKIPRYGGERMVNRDMLIIFQLKIKIKKKKYSTIFLDKTSKHRNKSQGSPTYPIPRRNHWVSKLGLDERAAGATPSTTHPASGDPCFNGSKARRESLQKGDPKTGCLNITFV